MANAIRTKGILILAALFSVLNICLIPGSPLTHDVEEIRKELQSEFSNASIKAGTRSPPVPTSNSKSGTAIVPKYRISSSSGFELLYVGRKGLGHRLVRMVNAYHFAKAIFIDTLHVDWASCVEDQYPIFDYLFGNSTLDVPVLENSLYPFVKGARILDKTDTPISRRILKFGNEVPMYLRAYRVKNLFTGFDTSPPHYGKLDTDLEMYQQLASKFRFRNEVTDFQKLHNFSDYTVLGLHIRAGNGETGDFTRKNRNILNTTEWVENVADLFSSWRDVRFKEKPPLVFLATDGQQLISKLERALARYSIPLVTVPQPRMPEGAGVAALHSHDDIQFCLDTWKSQFIDMMLLSESDVCIAGRYSSFTHSMPISFQFGKVQQRFRHQQPLQAWQQHGPPIGSSTSRDQMRLGVFCEIGTDGHNMECYDNFKEWIHQNSSLPTIGEPQPQNSTVSNSQLVFLRDKDLTKENLEGILEGMGLQLDYD